MPSQFRFGEVPSLILPKLPLPTAPSLGPVAAFPGTFAGSGFNTIFRPDSTATPTPLPMPVGDSDNTT